MKKQNDGGSAFPALDASGRGLYLRDSGMTLRDYFAAHAPFTMQDARDTWARHGDGNPATGRELMMVLANLRMAYADAMLAERAK